MNKTVKGILIVLLVGVVLVVAALANGKKSVQTISLEDYKTISSGDGFVYYGSNENLSKVENLAKEYGLEISFLDSEDEANKDLDLKKETLYEYKNGKEKLKYNGSFDSYKFAEALVENGMSPKSHVTVTLDEYKKIMKEKGYHLMFIGRETCGYCTQFKESIKEALKDHSFIIYYIDTDTFESEDEYSELIATDKYMSENEWGTPLSLLYKDGKRVDVLNGYVSADELVSFLEQNGVIS